MKRNDNKKVIVKQEAFSGIVDALRTKKEIKTRFQNGENLRTIAEEKGFKIVLPL